MPIGIRVHYAILFTSLITFTMVQARWYGAKPYHRHAVQRTSMDEEAETKDYSELRKLEERTYATRGSVSSPLAHSAEDSDEELENRSPYHRRRQSQSQSKRLRHYRREKHAKSQDYDIGDPLALAKELDIDAESPKVKDVLLNYNRGKRHNRRRAWTEKDRKSFNNSRSKPVHFDSEKIYEMEVREAQNSSLCNYTVVAIPDPGGRIPRELEHIKCNHIGSKCQDKGTYCCIQTYRNVEVAYESGKRETLKVYSGCVCSLQIYGALDPYIPDVDIDD